MKRTRLYLTGIGEILTESAEKKIEQGESHKIPTCDGGKTADWYEDMALDIPPELEERLKVQDKGITLEDEDFEETYSQVVVYEDQIKFIVTDYTGTTVFLDGDISVTVTETADEIDEYLDYLHRTEWE